MGQDSSVSGLRKPSCHSQSVWVRGWSKAVLQMGQSYMVHTSSSRAKAVSGGRPIAAEIVSLRFWETSCLPERV